MYNYPAAIKAFYMRANDDGKTVAAMDVLVPKVRSLALLFRAAPLILPTPRRNWPWACGLRNVT